jgi:hypothetical protein
VEEASFHHLPHTQVCNVVELLFFASFAKAPKTRFYSKNDGRNTKNDNFVHNLVVHNNLFVVNVCVTYTPPTKKEVEYRDFKFSSFISGGKGMPSMSEDEVAYGFIKVANETMCRPIRYFPPSSPLLLYSPPLFTPRYFYYLPIPYLGL